MNREMYNRNKETGKMKMVNIIAELHKGRKVVRDINGYAGIVSCGQWLDDVSKQQFAKLLADPSLDVTYPIGSVYAIEIRKR